MPFVAAFATKLLNEDEQAEVQRALYEAGKAPGMHPWREELFVLLNRGAANASRFFKLPADQVFEVGTHVEI